MCDCVINSCKYSGQLPENRSVYVLLKILRIIWVLLKSIIVISCNKTTYKILLNSVCIKVVLLYCIAKFIHFLISNQKIPFRFIIKSIAITFKSVALFTAPILPLSPAMNRKHYLNIIIYGMGVVVIN